ncbi:hypothetical protein ACGFZQ_39605 [Streptomyces sp. NPDC048254]|uniref:hypothetical protein n=1 Tax=Streptomyces sp. NPDC048254 TaxID=3365525 RepID=UPI003714D51B
MPRNTDDKSAGLLQQKLHRLEDQVRAHGGVYSRAAAAEVAGLSAKTVGEWFNRPRVPRHFEPLWAFLQVLLLRVSGRGQDTQDDRAWWAHQRVQWRYLWKGAKEVQEALPPRSPVEDSKPVLRSGTRSMEEFLADSGEGSRPPEHGQLVGDLRDPIALEVHPTIRTTPTAAELPVLTPYIERDHDHLLRQRVQEAADGQSSIAVLVGDSSAVPTTCVPSEGCGDGDFVTA